MKSDIYKIQYLPVGDIHLNPDNPRLIKDASFRRLVKSLQDAPDLFRARPLLCSDRTGELIVLGGNMRFRAALDLGYKEVPVIVMSGLTEAQEREIAIKDNGIWGEWDMDALANTWGDLPLTDWGVVLPESWLKSLDDKLPEAGSGIEKDNETICPKCGFKYAI
jgi:hypothetical protein